MYVHFNIIKRKRGNIIYLYKQTYTGIKSGKRQYQEKVLGHYDENGNFIASKNINIEEFQTEIEKFRKELGFTEKTDTLKTELPVNLPALPASENFTKIRQGTATNKLSKIDSRKNVKTDPITGIAKITQQNFEVALLNHAKLKGLRQSAHQLLDALTEVFTEKGGEKAPLVTLPLKEYMRKRGLNDEKEARKQVKEDLMTLSSIRLSFKQKLKGGESKDYFNLALIGSQGIKKGIITVYLDPVFCALLGGYNIMPYPALLWELNENQNPNSFYFLRKISEHKNMNFDDKNADTISVITLLTATPNIPAYDEIKDRHYTRQIINPFERDMDALNETLTWEYCHSNGIPLTNEELKNMDYEIFSKLYVKIFWKEYPDQTERIAKKVIEQKKKAKSRRELNKPIAL